MRNRIKFTLAQIGNLNNSDEAVIAVGLANQVQDAFYFDFYPKRLPLDARRYKLPNSGFDLDAAAKQLLKRKNFPSPLILLTSAPYGDREHSKEEGYFFFSDYAWEADPVPSIISTYLWETLPGVRRLQPYLLMMLAVEILSRYAGLEFHPETRGCLFDYCSDPRDADECLRVGRLCNSCDSYLHTKLKSGSLSLEHVVAAKKIFSRAMGRKMCFVAMPFNRALKPVYDVISEALKEEGWLVVRADEIARPRNIPIAIKEAILTSDLVVADITGGNPNVCYEVGIAHAVDRDLILVTQDRTIPINIATERAVAYKMTKRGFHDLKSQLKLLSGHGLS
jgi:hypothetical protein